MQASVNWDHGLSFTGTADTGFEVPLGAATGVGGDDDGFRPLELMLVSLAGCTGMDVISILRKMQQKVTGLKVEVNGEQANEHPKKFLSIHIEYTIIGYDLAEDRVARAIELSETKYCPAMASLRPGAPITSSYTILEAGADTMVK